MRRRGYLLMEVLPCTRIIASRYHVESCSFSPDGNLLAVCFGDYSVRLLRIAENERNNETSALNHAHPPSSLQVELEWVIKQHTESVWCARFSPDGQFLCTCSSDGTAKIWDLKSRTLARNFDAHSGTVWCCCYATPPALSSSPEGHIIATGSSDKTVKIWNTRTREILLDLDGYGDAIDSLAFSSGCELLCTSCRDGVVKIWMNLSLSERVEHSAPNKSTSSLCRPDCLALTYVNRSASRFCMFTNSFISYSNETTQVLHSSTEDTQLQIDTEITELERPKINSTPTTVVPNELLFASGPNNYISVWRTEDILSAFKNAKQSESQEETLSLDIDKSSLEKECASIDPSIEEDEVGSVSREVVPSVGLPGDHVIQRNALFVDNVRGEESSLQSAEQRIEDKLVSSVGTEKAKELETELRMETIVVEKTVSGGNMSTILNNSDERVPETEDNSHSQQSTSSSQSLGECATSTETNVPAACSSDELYGFYRVDPTWTLTDHLNTVWDCCIAIVHCQPKCSATSDKDAYSDKQILVSCSGDRTLRFWVLTKGKNASQAPSMKCIKVFQMPQEHSESQVLTCAHSSMHRLLAIGLFNGSLHLADLTDINLSIHSTDSEH